MADRILICLASFVMALIGGNFMLLGIDYSLLDAFIAGALILCTGAVLTYSVIKEST